MEAVDFVLICANRKTYTIQELTFHVRIKNTRHVKCADESSLLHWILENTEQKRDTMKKGGQMALVIGYVKFAIMFSRPEGNYNGIRLK